MNPEAFSWQGRRPSDVPQRGRHQRFQTDTAVDYHSSTRGNQYRGNQFRGHNSGHRPRRGGSEAGHPLPFNIHPPFELPNQAPASSYYGQEADRFQGHRLGGHARRGGSETGPGGRPLFQFITQPHPVFQHQVPASQYGGQGALHAPQHGGQFGSTQPLLGFSNQAPASPFSGKEAVFTPQPRDQSGHDVVAQLDGSGSVKYHYPSNGLASPQLGIGESGKAAEGRKDSGRPNEKEEGGECKPPLSATLSEWRIPALDLRSAEEMCEDARSLSKRDDRYYLPPHLLRRPSFEEACQSCINEWHALARTKMARGDSRQETGALKSPKKCERDVPCQPPAEFCDLFAPPSRNSEVDSDATTLAEPTSMELDKEGSRDMSDGAPAEV